MMVALQRGSALLYTALLSQAFGASLQTPFSHGVAADEVRSDALAKGRKLTGKFLHITDIHPDPYYRLYSSTDEDAACHRHRGPAGLYGAETSDCDSPMTLVNATFKWIEENLKDSIDFVIWTGDSARHDNDEDIRRSENIVLGQNQMLVDKLEEIFGKHGSRVPVIPTIGNNDLLPHNLMTKGPNKWTKAYAKMWKNSIPKDQRDDFRKGGWFYTEVIPNKLAVFSLNTMYFFDNNSEVDGCAMSDQPGYEHMEWLREKLDSLRERNVKVILSGHVPPARNEEKAHWYESCWQKYTLWLRQYRDIIIGAMYGHMNVEHFMLQDFEDLRYEFEDDSWIASSRGEFEMKLNPPDYLNSLREQWAELPSLPKSLFPVDGKLTPQTKKDKEKEEEFLKQIGGEWAERFAVTQVSNSLVPNAFPTMRVFYYNITGLEDLVINDLDIGRVWKEEPFYFQSHAEDLRKRDDEYDDDTGPIKVNFTVPLPPSKASLPGPGYSPQTLSWLGYTQYLANLTYINNDFSALSHSDSSIDQRENNDVDAAGWKSGKHHGRIPEWPPKLPREFNFEIEYDTRDKHDPYNLQDGLIVRRWVELAAKIGDYDPDKSNVLPSRGSSESIEEDVDSESEQGDAESLKKKKKKKKHKKRKIINRTWYAFASRAEAGTRDDAELQDKFGQVIDDEDEDTRIY